jgi:exopolyphosphatase / guanosine-5'-triphosphate,3'-diphosphate pyrophosphatase
MVRGGGPGTVAAMRVAVLDLGSNSFHLLVVDVSPAGAFIEVARERELLGLGGIVARTGAIGDADAEVAERLMRRFRATIERNGTELVLPVATQAFREAADGRAVVDRLGVALDEKIRVIDGETEARLAFLGMRAGIDTGEGPLLAMDLGGGSLEFAHGDRTGADWTASAPLGGTRLTAALVDHDPPSATERAELEATIRGHLAPLRRALGDRPVDHHVIAGGTVRALARVAAARRAPDPRHGVHGMVLGRDEVVGLDQLLATTPRESRLLIPEIKERRVDALPAAAAVIAAIVDVFGIERLTVSEWGLREGAIVEALGIEGVAHPGIVDIRRGAVRRLESAWAREPEHAERVRDVALALFDATTPVHGLGPVDRELLEYGALLHDIGTSVATGGHHKHGAYLVEHAGLVGFDDEELAVVASLVRFHKGSGPKLTYPPYATLRLDARRRVDLLSGLLRVADGVDLGRGARVQAVTAEIGARTVRLHVRVVGDRAGIAEGVAAKVGVLEAATRHRFVIDVTAADAA